MKIKIFLTILLMGMMAQAAELAPPNRTLVIKLAEGYDAETVAEAFQQDGKLGIEGVDSILSGWAVTVVDPVVWGLESENRNPDLFQQLGMNRYLVIGWGPDAAQRPLYIINRMLTQLRQQQAVEEASRSLSAAPFPPGG